MTRQPVRVNRRARGAPSRRAAVLWPVLLALCAGTVRAGPDPRVLLVVGDPALNAGDTALYNRLVNQNKAVTVVDDGLARADDAAGRDLVLLSATAAAAAVGEAFRGIPTPVVACGAGHFAALSLAAADQAGVAAGQTQVSARFNTPLAPGLSGLTAVTTEPRAFAWGFPGGGAIVGATLAGDDDGRATVFAHPRGAAMSGRAAAGPRVGLFLEADTATALNTDGWLLVDAALEWALDQAPVAAHALAPVPEPQGPSSRRTGLVISEILYHPAPRADGLELEFIEILNTEPFRREIGGYRLDGEVAYTFPDGLVLEPGARAVVARAPDDLRAASGFPAALGPWAGRLDNAGGRLRLRHRSGAVLLELDYGNEHPWPVAAAGAGPALVLARPSRGEADPAAWDAGARAGGTPGQPEPATAHPLAGLKVNELRGAADGAGGNFIELFNHGTGMLELGGVQVLAGGARHTLAAGLLLGPGERLALDEAVLGLPLSAADQVLVLDPAGGRVLDAVEAGPAGQAAARGRFPDGAPGFRRLQAATPGQPNAPEEPGAVVLNEILYHPPDGNADDEFIELHNPGLLAADLSGWRLAEAVEFTFPAGAGLPPGGFAVVTRNRARFLSRHPGVNPAAVFGDWLGELSDAGERIRLLRPEGAGERVEDEVAYRDGGQWGAWSDGGGGSLELTDPRADNRHGTNWADSDESAKAPWTPFSVTGVLDHGVGAPNELHLLLTGAGECLVDRLEVRRDSDGTGVNRVPNGDFETGVSDWIVQGNHGTSARQAGEGAEGSAASLRLVATGDGDNGVNRAEINLTSQLSAGQTAVIRGQARWLRGGTNLLARLKGNYLEVQAGLALPAGLGTPGAVNSRRVANAGPVIHDVRHHPVLPAALEAVTVTVRVEDAHRVASVTLRHRADPSAATLATPMGDAGLDGDAVAEDGIFTARVPGQAAGALLAFTVEAVDAAQPAASRAFPAADGAECLIRWGEPAGTGDFTAFRLWITAANLARWAGGERLSNAETPGTVVHGDFRVVHGAGMRYRGSPYARANYTSPAEGRLAGLLVRVPRDDEVLGSGSFSLDALGQDVTGGPLQRERMAFWMAEQLGAPHVHQRFCALLVNGTRRGAVYQDSQQPNRDHAASWHPGEEEGDLFEASEWFEFNDNNPVGVETSQDATLERFTTTGGAPKRARLRWNWRCKEGDGSVAALESLVDALHAPGDEAFLAAVGREVDTDSWWRTFTLRRVLGDWDGYGWARGKNAFLHRAPGGRWEMIPWDLDFTAGAGSRAPDHGLFAEVQDPVLARFYQLPPLQRAYWGLLRAAATGPMRPDRFDAVSGEIQSVLLANGIAAPDDLPSRQWVAQRRAFILGQLEPLDAPLRVTTNGGQDFTADASPVTLAGTAPVEAATLTLNGFPLEVTWTSVTNWTASVHLQPGTNALVFSALDPMGAPLPDPGDTIAIRHATAAGPLAGRIALTELMYHAPDRPGAPGTELEFIELKNTGDGAVDLAGAAFRDGIDFTFPPNTVLEPGAFLVLASNPGAFRAAYPWLEPAGEYRGQLANGGETVTLVDGTGGRVVSVTYDDRAPWPVAADGTGPSLVPLDPDAAGLTGSPSAWRASAWPGGSPGMDDPEPVAAAPVIVRQPDTVVTDAGGRAAFTCLATGFPAPAYQWRRDGVDIPGATGPVLVLDPAGTADSGAVLRCRVGNVHGDALSAPALLAVRGMAPLSRHAGGLVAYYPFNEGTGAAVTDQSGAGAPLDLGFAGGGVTWLPGRNGVAVAGESMLVSPGAATKVHEAVQAGRALTVELWANPANLTQSGPARMFGLAADANTRNFGLMQSGSNLDFRLRTSGTGNNGTPATSANGVMRLAPTHFVATYDEADGVKLYTNGVPAAAAAPSGNLANWGPAHRLALANEVGGGRAWAGELYLAAVYAAALTPEQVRRNHAAGSQPNPRAAEGPAFTSIPPDLTVNCAGDLPPAGVAGVRVEWNCSPTGTVAVADASPVDGTEPGAPSLIHRVFTAIDQCGLMSTRTQTFTVADIAAPVTASIPPDLTVECLESLPGPPVLAFTDNCAGTVGVTFRRTGTVDASGCGLTVLEQWEATDLAGNTARVTRRVAVRDATAPVLLAGPAGGHAAEPGLVPPANPAAVLAVDNCAGLPVVGAVTSVRMESGCLARIEHAYTVADACGNTSVHREVWTTEIPPGGTRLFAQPEDTTAAAGGFAVFRVAAAACPGATFQWWRDGAPIPGANREEVTAGPLAATDAGAQFWCVVGGGGTPVATRRALLTLAPAEPVAPEPPPVLAVREEDGGLRISLATRAGVIYRLQVADSLEAPLWLNCRPGERGSGADLVLREPAVVDRPRYYRIAAYPAPAGD